MFLASGYSLFSLLGRRSRCIWMCSHRFGGGTVGIRARLKEFLCQTLIGVQQFVRVDSAQITQKEKDESSRVLFVLQVVVNALGMLQVWTI